MPATTENINSILILGSGALKIGQAGEFDYSGSQAIKALKEEGIKTILINPNIATIQTSQEMADEVYFLPVTPEFVEQVIAQEKPDGVFLAFGGQTALNCGVELKRRGVFKKYNVQVLGTPVDSIELTEDREMFAQHLRKINIPTPVSKAASTLKEAKKIATELGFPVMVRAAYALGGQSSGVVKTQKQLEALVTEALQFSPQVLVEQYLHHFKEVEYEVVRDAADNCIAVCNMENFDPLGIHTGESIVIAPSQTLTSDEYHRLRQASIDIVRSLGIIGECNVQYALNPHPKNGEVDFYVIEVNARLSRSSALASKATGYPLAYVAAKIALGKNLPEIPNQITKVTKSFFEPALDYLVVKMPRWDMDKFDGVKQRIGTSMKSVGEVMGIGRSFEEAIQKSVRMLGFDYDGVTDTRFDNGDDEVIDHIKHPTNKRLFAVVEALKRGISVAEIHEWSGIDNWFLDRLKSIVETEQTLTTKTNPAKIKPEQFRLLKQKGIADKRIAMLTKTDSETVRSARAQAKITPSVFQIDTLAGEFPAQTNYLYMTYHGNHHDVEALNENGVVVLGSGPYRIGSSVEFDWASVNTALALQQYAKKSIIVNCNPETVSTDYDISSRLYFEELTLERVRDIYDFENSYGLIVSVGGQTPNNLVKGLAQAEVPILGTSPENIDRAEDRNKFSALLDSLDIPQPAWGSFTNLSEAKKFADEVDYPVLVRPSYVLSGDAMQVCYSEKSLKTIVKKAVAVNKDHPVVATKFFEEADEIEFDGVAENGQIKVYAICEHIEHAGVHSGDASIVYPPQNLYVRTYRQMQSIATKLVAALQITGPFNIQFLAKGNQAYVIEINLRASRTFPFVSKATGVNFARSTVEAIFGRAKRIKLEYPDWVVVKVPQFSFARLQGADPALRVEMASTGEVGVFGDSVEEAFLKAELSVGAKIPTKGVFISLGGEHNKVTFLESALQLKKLGIALFATEKTADFLQRNGIDVTKLYKVHEKQTPNILTCFQDNLVDLAINIVDPHLKKDLHDDYLIRRAAVDHNIYLISERNRAQLFIKALVEEQKNKLQAKPWRAYA